MHSPMRRIESERGGIAAKHTIALSASMWRVALPLLLALLAALPGVHAGGCVPITFNDTLYMANCGQAIVFAPSDGVPKSFILYYGWKRESHKNIIAQDELAAERWLHKNLDLNEPLIDWTRQSLDCKREMLALACAYTFPVCKNPLGCDESCPTYRPRRTFIDRINAKCANVSDVYTLPDPYDPAASTTMEVQFDPASCLPDGTGGVAPTTPAPTPGLPEQPTPSPTAAAGVNETLAPTAAPVPVPTRAPTLTPTSAPVMGASESGDEETPCKAAPGEDCRVNANCYSNVCSGSICLGRDAGEECSHYKVCNSKVCLRGPEFATVRGGITYGICQGLGAGETCEEGQCEPPLTCEGGVCTCPNCCLGEGQCGLDVPVDDTAETCCEGFEICCKVPGTGMAGMRADYTCCGLGEECHAPEEEPEPEVNVGTCGAVTCPQCCLGEDRCRELQNGTEHCCPLDKRCCLSNLNFAESGERARYLCCDFDNDCTIDENLIGSCGALQDAFAPDAATRATLSLLTLSVVLLVSVLGTLW